MSYTIVLHTCIVLVMDAMRNQNILISGASVAGPALAWWLAHHGFRPTVVERAPHLRGRHTLRELAAQRHLCEELQRAEAVRQ